DRSERHARVREQDVGLSGRRDDRIVRLENVERNAPGCAEDHERVAETEQRVAVGGGARDEIDGDRAGAARPAVDDSRLAPVVGQYLCGRGSDRVSAGAGAGGDDEPYGANRVRVRLVLRYRNAFVGEHGDREAASQGSFHAIHWNFRLYSSVA